MKKFVLPFLLAVLGLMVLTGCNNDDNNGGGSGTTASTSNIVGVWDWTDPDSGMTVIGYYGFDANGTGVAGFEGIVSYFNWRTSGNNLYITHTSGFTFDLVGGFTEEWTYTLTNNNNTLRIDSRQEAGVTWTYTRN